MHGINERSSVLDSRRKTEQRYIWHYIWLYIWEGKFQDNSRRVLVFLDRYLFIAIFVLKVEQKHVLYKNLYCEDLLG